jgi:hypothetical protein
VEIANAIEVVQDGRIYIQLVNGRFLSEGGTPNQFRAGLAHAIASGWLWLHESGTYVKFTPAGCRDVPPEAGWNKGTRNEIRSSCDGSDRFRLCCCCHLASICLPVHRGCGLATDRRQRKPTLHSPPKVQDSTTRSLPISLFSPL